MFTEPCTNCIGRTRSHLRYPMSRVWHIIVSIIEVMRINRAYYKSFLSLLSIIYDLTNINVFHIWVNPVTTDRVIPIVILIHFTNNNLLMHLLISLIFHGHVLYCYRYSWVKITGTEYRPGDILVWKFTDDTPTFCRLNKIYSDSCDNFYFDCIQLEIPHYDSHYHAYIVDTSSNVASVLCQQAELCDHHSYSLHHSFNPALRNIHFVVPKYHIIDYLHH